MQEGEECPWRGGGAACARGRACHHPPHHTGRLLHT